MDADIIHKTIRISDRSSYSLMLGTRADSTVDSLDSRVRGNDDRGTTESIRTCPCEKVAYRQIYN